MAAPTILQVMQGIETQLATISGLRTSEYMPDQVNPPIAIVGVPPIENYRQTMGRGRFQLEPQVFVLVSASLDTVGQAKLAGYANPTGATSIPAAIEADQTLGGVAETCVVDSFRPLGMEEVGALQYYGGVFDLRVIVLGA